MAPIYSEKKLGEDFSGSNLDPNHDPPPPPPARANDCMQGRKFIFKLGIEIILRIYHTKKALHTASGIRGHAHSRKFKKTSAI